MYHQNDESEQNFEDQNQVKNEEEINSLFNSLSTQLSDYIISHPIGTGAGSLVVKVQSIKTKKEYAIKVVDKSSSYYKSAYKRLKNEIDVHLELKHKNIVKMIKSFEDDENMYLVMEYCEGGDLFHYLKHHKKLSENEAKRISYELAEGIKYLHDKSIIHRDLKLGNVILTSDHTVKICDFGLAARLNGNEQEKSTICGTPNYISPEILNKQPYGMKIDCWSFGCVLYALITGHPPFQGQDVVQTLKKVTSQEHLELPSNISSTLKDLLANIINWNQESRFTINQILEHPFYGEMRQKQKLEEEQSLSFFNSIRSVKGNDERLNVHQGDIKKIDIKYQDNFFNQLDNRNGSIPKSQSPTMKKNNQQKQVPNLKKNEKEYNSYQNLEDQQIKDDYKKQSKGNLIPNSNQKDINYARKNSPVDREFKEQQAMNLNPKSVKQINEKQKQNSSFTGQKSPRKQSPGSQYSEINDSYQTNENKNDRNVQNLPKYDNLKSPKLQSGKLQQTNSVKSQDIKQTFQNNYEKIKSQQPPIPPQIGGNNSALLSGERKMVRSVIYNHGQNKEQENSTNLQQNNINNNLIKNNSAISNYSSNSHAINTNINNTNINNGYNPSPANNSNLRPTYCGNDKYLKNNSNIRNNSPANNSLQVNTSGLGNLERTQSPNISCMTNGQVSNSQLYSNKQIENQQKNNSYALTQNSMIPLPERVQTNFVQNLNILNDIDRFSPPHNSDNGGTRTESNSYVSHNRTKQVSFENKPLTQKNMQRSDQGFYKKNPVIQDQSKTQRNQQQQGQPEYKSTNQNANYYLTKKDNNMNYDDVFTKERSQNEENISSRLNTENAYNRLNTENFSGRLNNEKQQVRLNTDYGQTDMLSNKPSHITQYTMQQPVFLKSEEKKQKSDLIQQIPMRSSQVQLTSNQKLLQQDIPLTFFNENKEMKSINKQNNQNKPEKVITKHFKNQASDNILLNQNSLLMNNNKDQMQLEQKQKTELSQNYQKIRFNTNINGETSQNIDQLNSTCEKPYQKPMSQTKIDIPSCIKVSKQSSSGTSRQITERGVSKSISNMSQFTSQQNLHSNLIKQNEQTINSDKPMLQNYISNDVQSYKNSNNIKNFVQPQNQTKQSRNLESKHITEKNQIPQQNEQQYNEDMDLNSTDNLVNVSNDENSSRAIINPSQNKMIGSKTHQRSNQNLLITQQSYQGALNNISENKQFQPQNISSKINYSNNPSTQAGVSQSLQVQTFRNNEQILQQQQQINPSYKTKQPDLQEQYRSVENKQSYQINNMHQYSSAQNLQKGQQIEKYTSEPREQMFTNYLQQQHGLKMHEQYQLNQPNSICSDDNKAGSVTSGSSHQTLSNYRKTDSINNINNHAKPFLPHQLLQNNINKRQQKIASADSTACTNASSHFLLQVHTVQNQSVQNAQPSFHQQQSSSSSKIPSNQRLSHVYNYSVEQQQQQEFPNHYYLKNSAVMGPDTNFASPVQNIKNLSRIQNNYKTEMSDYESNNQNNTINTLDYYESPRLNTLNILLSPDGKQEPNSTAQKNASQMKTLLSGNKESSSYKNNSNNTSKYARLSPLRVGRLQPNKISTQNGTIEITENRDFILKSLQKNITMIISPDGRDITLIKDEEPSNQRCYTIDRLPEKYSQLYEYCKKKTQEKTPKVKLENEDGQFVLYDNKFLGLFSNGYIINHQLNSQILEIQNNKYSPKIYFDLLKDIKHASKEIKLLVQKTQKIVSIITSMKS